jgi:putative ABC transport system permease protein
MSSILQDLKFAARNLRRVPGFAAVVIATLALGIGANTAIFSIVNTVVLQPLPFAAPDRLVRITSELRAFGATDTGVAPLELFDYQSRTDLFSGVAGLYPINANVTGGAEPERIEALLVTWNYFSILGAAPQLGRVFGPDDDGPGIPEVAVVSDAYWRRRLGADPAALGRTITVDGDPFVLVGIMPPDFRHPGRTVQTEVDLWAPAGYRALPFSAPNRRSRFLEGGLARLQPGVTAAQAQSALDAYASDSRTRFAGDYPASSGWNPLLVPLQEDVVGRVAAPMLILLGAVGFVLLIACANVANLMLTRASQRQQEMAIRISLGATSRRLAGQILTESAVLAAAGGVFGVLLASWGLRVLVAIAPSRVPRLSEVSLDGQTLLVALALSIVSTLLFGFAPAWQMRGVQVAAVQDAGRGRSAGPRSTRARNALIAAEVAMAMVLLVGAGLLARSFWALQDVPLGFETRDLLTARVWLPRPNDPANGVYLSPENRLAFAREALARIQALPGVERAAISTQVPMGGYNAPVFFEIDGQAAPEQEGRMTAHLFQVSDGYFETMRIPIASGRPFNAFDRTGTEPVAIVSEAAVARFWGSANPVGSRVRFSPQAPWMTVVGVAGDVRHRRLDEPPQPMLYRPFEQASSLTLAFLMRTAGSAPGLADAVSREVRAVDPTLPVYAPRTMDDLLAGAVAQRRFLMRVLILFGGAAIVLALVGIYGVISYAVAQRTREIGIRVAIGARRGQVLGLVLRQGLTHAGAGMAAGVVLAVGLARLLTSQLFGVEPFDPLTLGAVLTLMALVALAAVAIPARRAARVDPIVALRQ